MNESNITASKHMKHKLLQLKGETKKSTTFTVDFDSHSFLAATDRPSRQKVSEDTRTER